MPQVVFRSADGELEGAISTDAPDGGSLGDLCDQCDSPVPFSCRSATCGTCRIVVLEGADLLFPAQDEEVSLLGIFGVTAESGDALLTQRLACQAQIRPGPGRIVLRPVADDEP
jgi:2Fe-2S ferredoxin